MDPAALPCRTEACLAEREDNLGCANQCWMVLYFLENLQGWFQHYYFLKEPLGKV
jgi:hypothetical protein